LELHAQSPLKHYCKPHGVTKDRGKKFDALAKDLSDNFSVCARTDTREVSISSRSTTTDQHSVHDHYLHEIMAALKV